jgi:hypothetical protein
LGQVLGGVLGGGTQEQTGGTEGSAAGGAIGGGTAGALGGLLGALGGATGQDSGSVEQPSLGGRQPTPDAAPSAIDASSLAPVRAPIPAPANRGALSFMPGVAPSTGGAAPADSLTVPSPTFTPKSEPEPNAQPGTTDKGAAQPSRKKADPQNPVTILKGFLK